MLRRMLMFTGLVLLLIPPLWADEIILDSGDTQDWVRIMEQIYPKSKDSLLRPTALLKFQTQEIPAGAQIESATLYLRQVRTTSGATITVSYVSDDSWSFDKTDAVALYQWPVKSFIDSYNTGG